MRGSRRFCLLLLVPLIAGCSRCAKGPTAPRGATSIQRFLPRVADGVLVIPNLDQFGAKLRQLERLKLASFVSQLEGFPSAEAFVGGALEQLGVDLRSPDELARAGIDSSRGAAMAFVSARRRYLVIAVADPLRFREAVRRLATNRLGATVESTREELGRSITSFARPGEAGAVLALVAVDGFALIATDEAVEELAGYAALSSPESLAEAQLLSFALAHLPATPDLYLHLPTTSNFASRAGLANSTVAVELTQKGLHLRAHLPQERTSPWLPLLQETPAVDLTAALPMDAFFFARFAGDPAALVRLWTRAADQLANLESGVEVAVSLAPTAIFSQMPSLDFRRTNPFRYFHLVAVAPVKSSQAADEMLQKLPPLAAALGALGQGLHFAQRDRRVVAGSPMERIDQALEQLSKPANKSSGPMLGPELRKALTDRPFAAVLDLPALTQSIRRMPASAWGIGGFAIKATTVRWLDALDDLRAVTLAAYAGKEAIEVEVDLRFVGR